MGNDDAKLFVAGLPDSVSEDVLKQLFEATGGTVLQVSLPKDRATGRPRGFGFVTMSSAAQAQTARDALDGSLQSGRSISVRPFQAEPPRRGEGGPPSSRMGPPGAGAGPRPMGAPGGGPGAPDRTLYVGNLPYDCTQPELETLINGVTAGAGQVVRIHMPMDADGRKRGFGFVTMSSAETAKAASELLKTADLRGRRLVVNLAHPKGERSAGPGGGGYSGGGFSGGGGGGGFSGGGGGGGGFGPPAQQRRTFDSDRRRKQHASGGEDGPPRSRGSAGKGTKSDPDDDKWDKRDWGTDDEK
jgi:RNA recognition motif-containing protein